MLIDITLKITPEMMSKSGSNSDKSLFGHVGTHFDVMDKEFPLEYTERSGLVFDVSSINDRDIDITDIDMEKVQKDMFIAFYTSYIEKTEYASKEYFSSHPQLSVRLINELVERGISIIGIDFAGIRRGKEHTPKDAYCADRGVFVIENLCNLGEIFKIGEKFTARTYPMNCTGMTGLPCRVIAQI